MTISSSAESIEFLLDVRNGILIFPHGDISLIIRHLLALSMTPGTNTWEEPGAAMNAANTPERCTEPLWVCAHFYKN